MDVYDLPDVGAQQDAMRAGIARLIELVGTEKFEEEVFQVAREATRCEHLTAFASRTDAAPRVLYAANVGPMPVARDVARKYVDKYWTLDPARRLDAVRPRGPRNTAIRIISNDIADGSYRRECYTQVKLRDRFTVLQRRNHETVCLNFYRDVGSGPFGGSEVDRIVNAADLLISLLMKQEISHCEGKQNIADTFVDRLRLIDPTLSPREADVCSAIACGMTSEAIALSLGISINTVLTYRKRAYMRLGISSQNELMRLVLS